MHDIGVLPGAIQVVLADAANDVDLGTDGSHAMTGARRRLRTHLLEHEPSLRRHLEGCELANVGAIDATPTEDVHDIVNDGGRMAFPWGWDIPGTGELCPRLG